jgi:hypothetical protein
MGHVADVYQSTPHDDSGSYDGGDSEVKTTRLATGALHRPQRGIKTRSGTSSQGVAHRLAAARRPPAGLNPEPACLEMAGGVPRYSASNQQLQDRESWDFDGNEQTSARRRTRRSPMLTHETSPVSGASVVGMTSGACHGPSYLPAGVPGVSMALGREDQLHPKGRLRQQPAGDSTEESQSRAMKTKASQRLFRQKWASPDKSDRGNGWE